MSSEGAEYLLAVLAERGLSVVMREDGRPGLRGPEEEKTPAVLRMLKEYRAEILARFGLPDAPPAPAASPAPEPSPAPSFAPLREWLTISGLRHAEEGPPAPAFPAGGKAARRPDPCGAWWWRWQGEPGWRWVAERMLLWGEYGMPDLPEGERMLGPGEGLVGPAGGPGDVSPPGSQGGIA